MTRLEHPTGILKFRAVQERDCYYVGRTRLIHRLVDKGQHYFLSRPRRFGRSLPLDSAQMRNRG